jgi:beta-glucosidase
VLDESALGVTVVVRNTGSWAGREVVQAYVEPHSLERGRPPRTLAAFATVTAKPGRAAEARWPSRPRAFAC